MRICPTVRNSALLPANGTNGTTITTCTREVENNNQVSETPPLFQSPLPQSVAFMISMLLENLSLHAVGRINFVPGITEVQLRLA